MGHGARAVDSSLVTFFVSGCRFVRAREEEPHGNAQHAHLCATRSAPKGRNNEAQANGLGLGYPPILSPALKGRDTAGRARNCLRRAVQVGLKRIVPPLQGSGIGLGPVDLAPKGRNNEAQANGLGLDALPIFTLSPERAR
jgi:hypothetical protein